MKLPLIIENIIKSYINIKYKCQNCKIYYIPEQKNEYKYIKIVGIYYNPYDIYYIQSYCPDCIDYIL